MPGTGWGPRRVAGALVCLLVIGLVLDGLPVSGQPGGQPPAGGPPGEAPPPGQPGAAPAAPKPPSTPLEAVDAAIEHLDERKRALEAAATDTPTPLIPFDPPPWSSGVDYLDAYIGVVACLIAVGDLARELKKYGEQTYEEGSNNLDEFRKKLKEFNRARPTEADLQKAKAHIDTVRSKMKDPPSDQDIAHDLYHWASGKKLREARALGIGTAKLKLVEPKDLRVILGGWVVIDCKGEECEKAGPAEKEFRQGGGR
jgi:hypothetical protein